MSKPAHADEIMELINSKKTIELGQRYSEEQIDQTIDWVLQRSLEIHQKRVNGMIRCFWKLGKPDYRSDSEDKVTEN